MQVAPQAIFANSGFGAGTAGTENAAFTTPSIEVPRDSCAAVIMLSFDISISTGTTNFTMNLRRGSGTGGAMVIGGQNSPFTVNAVNRFHLIGCDTLSNQGTVQYTVTCNPAGAPIGVYLQLCISVLLFF